MQQIMRSSIKILLSIIASAMLSTQLSAGFLNFDGELTTRVQNQEIGTLTSSTRVQTQLKLEGQKRLGEGYKVNYGVRTAAADILNLTADVAFETSTKSGFFSTTTNFLRQEKADIALSIGFRITSK